MHLIDTPTAQKDKFGQGKTGSPTAIPLLAHRQQN